jgi:hypothetical protein
VVVVVVMVDAVFADGAASWGDMVVEDIGKAAFARRNGLGDEVPV